MKTVPTQAARAEFLSGIKRPLPPAVREVIIRWFMIGETHIARMAVRGWQGDTRYRQCAIALPDSLSLNSGRIAARGLWLLASGQFDANDARAGRNLLLRAAAIKSK